MSNPRKNKSKKAAKKHGTTRDSRRMASVAEAASSQVTEHRPMVTGELLGHGDLLEPEQSGAADHVADEVRQRCRKLHGRDHRVQVQPSRKPPADEVAQRCQTQAPKTGPFIRRLLAHRAGSMRRDTVAVSGRTPIRVSAPTSAFHWSRWIARRLRPRSVSA